MSELTIDDLTIEQGGMIAMAYDNMGCILTSRELPKSWFKPLIKLGIFEDLGEVSRKIMIRPYTQYEYIEVGRHTEYQLTDYGVQLLLDGWARMRAEERKRTVANEL